MAWDLWHLPLWLMTGYGGAELLHYVAAFSVAIVSLSALMTWIYLRAQRSLALMSLTHFAFNLGFALAGPQGLGLGPALPLLDVTAALLAAVAVALWAVRRLRVAPSTA